MPSPESVRVAIVGAGPAGLYAAHALAAALGEAVAIDLFERWPTPFGLLRFGVAPDAVAIKETQRSFERILGFPGLRYWGNVRVGVDLGVAELRQHYHQVLLATGAPLGRRLGVPGESRPGHLLASQLIGWYNAQPEHQALSVDWAEVERMVIVGMGNTALDVARVLLTPPEQLARTDMSDAALGALRQSRLRHVVILGRRGPAEAAFDPRELKSLGALPELSIRVDPRELTAAERDGGERSKLLDVLSAYVSRSSPDSGRTVTLRFRLSPVELVGPEHVRAIRVESRQKTLTGWRGTGQTEVLAADLVLSAVGFRGEPLAGVPFDAGAGVVPSDRGRVSDGLYVTGWLKRGARGLLGTTKADSYETVERMLEALPPEGARALRPPSGLSGRLLERGVRVVGLDDWHRLDRLEVARGRASGQPRRKLASVSEMLAALEVSGLAH